MNKNRKQKFLEEMEREIPDETSIPRFRRFLEEHELKKEIFEGTKRILAEEGHLLKTGTIVDATIIKASSSTKNKAKKREEQMISGDKAYGKKELKKKISRVRGKVEHVFGIIKNL